MQMRLLAATINLRVNMRRELGKETTHRRICAFFHSRVQDYCDRRRCMCAANLQQKAASAAAAAPADGGVDNGGDGDDSQGGSGGVQAGHAAAAGEVARCHPVHAAVADALPAVVLDAVDAAAQRAGLAAAQAAGHVFGRAAGLAAVQAAFHFAEVATDNDADGAASHAAAAAAGEVAALAPIQATIEAAVQQSVLVEAAEIGQRSSRAAAEVICAELGSAAGIAAARAVDDVAGRRAPAADAHDFVAADAAAGVQGASGPVDGGGVEPRREGQGAGEGVGQHVAEHAYHERREQRRRGKGVDRRDGRQDPGAGCGDLAASGTDQIVANGVVSGQPAVCSSLLDALRGLGVFFAARDDPLVAEEPAKLNHGVAGSAVDVRGNVLGQASSDSECVFYSGGEASADEHEL